jgi:beta-lactamase regulating signal transducer with metallopeptidase domain
MNALVSLYPGDDAVRLVASAAVQIAGVVVLALAAAWAVARRNAALRHGIWLAALAWVCIAPLAAWGLQRAGITIAVWHRPAKSASAGLRTDIDNALHSETSAADQIGVIRAEQPRRSTPLPDGVDRAHGAPRSPVPPEPQAAAGTAFEAAFGAITTIWAAGLMLLLARLVWGLRVVAGIRRELIPFTDLPDVVADRLRRTLGVNALPKIMLSRRVCGPATIGLRRPVIVLPAELAAAMTASELHDALAHECAHALRHDARIALVQQLVAALYWPHPLVHVLNRQLARAREETCDNVVLSGTTAADYARTLLSLSQSMHAAGGRIAVVQMFDKRWRLAHRVAGLLNTRRIVMTRMNRRAVALVAISALAFGTTLAAISTAGDQPEDAKSSVKFGLSATRALGNTQEDLDVRAAIAAADVAKYLYLKNKEAYDTVKNSVPLVEIKRLESVYKLALLQVEQAERKANKLSGDTTAAEFDTPVAGAKPARPRYAELAEDDVKLVRRDNECAGPLLEERRAELDLREATVVLKSKKQELERLLSMQVNNGASKQEVEQAKLNTEIAEIQLERAELASASAHSKVKRLRLGAYVVFPLPDVGPLTPGRAYYAEHQLHLGERDTVIQLLENGGLILNKVGNARVSLISYRGSLRETLSAADELKPADGVLIQDLLNGKAKNEVVHRGDFVVVLSAATTTALPPVGKAKAGSNATTAASDAKEDVEIRIAKVAAEIAKYEYLKTKEAYEQVKNSVPFIEVKRLELAYQLAVLQVEQAERRANERNAGAKTTAADEATDGVKPARGK